jgi:hypothetical protein
LEGDSALPLSHFDMPLIAKRRSSAALQKIIFASCGSGFVKGCPKAGEVERSLL